LLIGPPAGTLAAAAAGRYLQRSNGRCFD